MHDENEPRSGEGEPSDPQLRSTYLAAIAGSVILVGLVAFSLYRRNLPQRQGDASQLSTSEEAAGDAAGGIVSATAPIHLSPEASVIVERYRCVCGCNDPLGVCTCTRTPGSIDMKEHLQALVDQKLSVEEIDEKMVEKYGPEALLSTATDGAAVPPSR